MLVAGVAVGLTVAVLALGMTSGYSFVGADRLRVVTIDDRVHMIDLRTGDRVRGE